MEICLQAKDFDLGRRSTKDLNVFLLLIWEVIPICQFFSYLTGIINLVASSSKRHDQLRDIEASHITKLIDSGVLEIGKGKNQVGTLQRPADGINDAMAFVEFVFILHFMIEMFGITDDLYQALQYKLQDILNMRQLVSSTKTLLQKFIEHGWNPLFEKMKLFCKDHEIEVLNLSVSYKTSRAEMNSLFNDEVVELLILIFTLDPRDDYKSFRVEDICKLMNDFYSNGFME
ncbi:hypothetical protein GOBAR_DD09455 [Gossypium barbadense]|nr:hypothetical protein GOBAR_DD09455 [Gossypium barbadense]